MTLPTQRQAWLAARIVLTLVAFAAVLWNVDLSAMFAQAAATSPTALLLAAALTAVNLGVGALRWRALLRATGAHSVPPMATLTRLYVVAFFYNTWLPGGLGGDAVRGVAAREAFGERGTSQSLAVVLVERVLGLVGLLLLLAAAAPFAPSGLASPQTLVLCAVMGLAGALGTLVALSAGSRLLPGRIPAIVARAPFAEAVALSVVSQVVGAVAGHAILSAVAPSVTLATSLVAIPLALTSSYLPFLVGGTGVRELAFIALLGRVGVNEVQAVTGSLLIYASQLAVALAGAFLRVR